MTVKLGFPAEALALVAAPMVDASELPFRLMCIKGGATMTYTQMYLPEKIKNDAEYRNRALNDLHFEKKLPEELRRPVIVQLGGRDIREMVEAAQLFAPHCDGIDINCGCPQEPAVLAGYGSALLARKEWDHLEKLAVEVPISVKIRLCIPVEATVQLAKRLEAIGVSHITLHARYPSAKHRRHGPAKLEHVKELVEVLNIPVLSNGNVGCYDDLSANRSLTGAAGLMVGEELMRNPYLFSDANPDPFDLTNEYLGNCKMFLGSATPKAARQHIRYFFERPSMPKAWGSIVKKRLAGCESISLMGPVIAQLKAILPTITDC